MAQLQVTVEGDASGAVSALQSTQSALAAMGSAGASASAGLETAGSGADRAFISIERTGSGLRALASSAGVIAPAMAGVAGASSDAATGVGVLATALVIAASAADPLVGALEAVTMVAGFFASSSAAASSAAAGAGATAGQAASGFVTLGDGSQVSGQQIAAAAASFTAYAASGQPLAGMAAEIAQALEVQAGSARTAGEEATYLAQQSAELSASQSQMQGELRASAGSMDNFAQSAAAAGMSMAEWSNQIGTQTQGSNPNGGLAIAGNTDYSYTPGHAMGGTTYRGESYIVGERGPELFTPNSGGYVSPNGSFGGNTVNYYLAIGSVMGVDDLRSQIMEWLRDASLYQSDLRGF